MTNESNCDTNEVREMLKTQKACLAGTVPMLLATSNRLRGSGPSAYLHEYFACFTAADAWWHGSALFKGPLGNCCETSGNQLV